MSASLSAFYAVIDSTRGFMNEMNQLILDVNQETGVNSCMRGVFLVLTEHDGLTVPQMARRMSLSRQYLQRNINDMIDNGWLSTRQNPDHKKSAFIELTAKGRHVFRSVLDNEKAVFDQLDMPLSETELRDVAVKLDSLTAQFRHR